MINKKIFIFILVIVLLSITCYYFYSIEKFTSNCKEFKNINLVFHKLNYEPTINDKKFYNYINQDFIDKFLVNNMNSIYKPLKIRFNNVDLVEENLEKNLRDHYDNFKVNYKSYNYNGKDATERYPPKNNDSITSVDKDYNALFNKIKNNQITLPVPKRVTKQTQKGIRQTTSSLTTTTPSLTKTTTSSTPTTPSSTTTTPLSTTTPSSTLFQHQSNNITEQSSGEKILERLIKETNSVYYNSTIKKDYAYHRMSPLQRFLIDNDIPDIFDYLQLQDYNLDMLIKEGKASYNNGDDAGLKNTKLNAFFDILDIPLNPYSYRNRLRDAIIDWDDTKKYIPAIVDDAVLMYPDYKFQGDEVILKAGNYLQENIRTQLSKKYKDQLDSDKTNNFIINVGNQDKNPTTIDSKIQYGKIKDYLTAGLEIDDMDNFIITQLDNKIKIKIEKQIIPGWDCSFYNTPDIVNRLYNFEQLIQNTPDKKISTNYINFDTATFNSLEFNDKFHLSAKTYINPAISGIYTFGIGSDDGSAFTITDMTTKTATVLINNDGIHNYQVKSATHDLNKNTIYEFHIYYFNKNGSSIMKAMYKEPNTDNWKYITGYHEPSGWSEDLKLNARFIDGDIFPITSLIVPNNVIFEMYKEDNLTGDKIIIPPGKYESSYRNVSRYKSFKVRDKLDNDNLNKYLNDLAVIGYYKQHSGQTNQPIYTTPSDFTNIVEYSMYYPSLPVDNLSFIFPVSTKELANKSETILPKFSPQNIGTTIEVNGPGKICSEMLDKFVKIDLKIIKELLNKDLSKENTKILLNLFLNAIDDSKYDDDKLHVYFLPFLPNNKKCYVIKGLKNKPLILLSLYNGKNNSKNIQTYDTTSICKNFLSDYLVNKQQLNKFEDDLDILINGNRNLIKKLNDEYKEKLKTIENNKSKNPNIENIIKKYNCNQKQLIEYYSKDYMKTTEVMKLNRSKHKGNYKVLLLDKIKELKDIDKIKITKLTKESIDLKEIMDKSNPTLKNESNELEKIKQRLIFLYSGNSDKKLKNKYTQTINLLKAKTNKLDYLMKKLGPPIMLSKIYSILSGLNSVNEKNDSFNVLNSIKDNGIIVTQTEKDTIVENSYKKNYLNYKEEFNTYDNFIDTVNILNSKCDLIPLENPTRADVVKTNEKIPSNSESVPINNSSKFIKEQAIYKKKKNDDIFSYAGYVSDIENNTLKFNYNTKEDLDANDLLFTGNDINKANCLLSTNYYYTTPPNLSLSDKIIILREIIKKRDEFTYLDIGDIKYLEKLLLFLERTYFGKDYRSTHGNDLSNDKLDENYFIDTIFTKDEALKILEETIVEAYNKKGGFNINSKLSLNYRDNYNNEDNFYKDSVERNKLAPTRRIYTTPKEEIPCPLSPKESFIKKDNRTLDDYMMNPIKCDKEKYMDSFDNSFI